MGGIKILITMGMLEMVAEQYNDLISVQMNYRGGKIL